MADADHYREISYISRDGGVTSVAKTEIIFRDGNVCRVIHSKVDPTYREEVLAGPCCVDYERRVLEARMRVTRYDAAFCGREDLIEPTG